MTSWEANALGMARALSTLIGSAAAEGQDLDVALLARDAALVAVRLVTRDILRHEHGSVTPHIGLLETDPAAAFVHCLNSAPLALRPGGDPPSTVLGRALGSTSGSVWRSLALEALSVQAAWPQLDLTRMSSAQTWAVVADTAAITNAVLALDRSLEQACTAEGRPAEAQRLRQAAATGLRLATSELEALAVSGELVYPAAPAPSRSLRPLRATQPEVLPVGLRRLGALARASHDLTPAQLRRAVLAVGEVCRAAAEAISGPTEAPRLHEALERQHALLRRAALDRSVSLHQPVERALQLQAAELVIAARGLAGLRGSHAVRLAERVSTVLPGTLSDLCHATRREVAAGHWATPDNRDNPTTRFAVANVFEAHLQPRLLVRLSAAVEHAQATMPVTRNAPRFSFSRTSGRIAAHDVLDVLSAAGRRPPRPTQPWTRWNASQPRHR